jgi:hypothetical protein
MVHVRKALPDKRRSSFSIVDTSKYPEVQQYGSFHFVSGVDVSTPASPAAYFAELMHDQMQAGNPWRLVGGTFCCYNAFSKVDVRIDVRLPGSIEAYCVDERGERYAEWFMTAHLVRSRSVCDSHPRGGV